MTGVGRELNRVAAAADRITVVLDEQPTVQQSPDAERGVEVGADISFERVCFRYGEHLPDAVHDVTFTVAPGETVALVGMSGAGKSTCANLLLRLWDPMSGTVRIGGHDLRSLPLDQIPDLVAYVPQDVYLFNGTIADNIAIGRPAVTDEDIRRAATTAQAAEFIDALPRGYDTELGEHGARLSGGQRQRIAIARAVLSNAPILVMDEAVSNLDTESETALHHAIRDLAQRRTVLIIAHRPSTIRTADRIVVLDHGRVVDEGHYAKLVSNQGPFATLLRQGLDRPS